LPGFPSHNLHLNIGLPIILLQNTNTTEDCNRTRLVNKKIMENVIKVTILNGKFREGNVLLPRIPMISINAPIQLKCL